MPVNTKRRHADTDTKRVFKEIRALAITKGPDFKLPTTRELSVRYDTSKITLDNVLRQLEQNEIIYRRQGSGIYVSPKIHRKTIVVLLDSTFFAPHSSPFWGMLWAQFAKQAEHRAGFKDEEFQFHVTSPLAMDGFPLPEQVMADIEEGSVHGVLCIGMRSNSIEWIESHNIPTVTFAVFGKWMVAMGMDGACRMAVNSLTDDGCRAIGFWTVVSANDDQDDMKRFSISRFRSAIAERGATFDPDHCVYCHSPADASNSESRAGMGTVAQSFPTYQEQGYHEALRLFGNPNSSKPDGLIIEDDMMADGAIAALEQLGIRVGVDVKIAAYTNAGSPILFRDRNKVIRVEFDPSDITQSMLGLLDDAMAGTAPNPREVQVEATVRRGSMGLA